MRHHPAIKIGTPLVGFEAPTHQCEPGGSYGRRYQSQPLPNPSRAAGSACTRPNRRDSKGSERGRRESTRRRADRPARKTHGLLPDASQSAISPATKAATVSSVASFKEIWWALRTRSGNTSWNNLLAISASSCVSICCSSSAFSRMGFFSSFALLISGDIAACLRWEWLELLG